MPNATGGPGMRLGPETEDVSWSLRTAFGLVEWDWSAGDPDPRALRPVRRPRSGAQSKHIPVRAFSTTTGNHLQLESGLEHDLVRLLDQEPTVTWLVSQPCLLAWRTGQLERGHVPDLLSVDADGLVSLWDVKAPAAASSEAFAEVRALTEAACAQVGWRYNAFTGLASAHRHNLIWLHGFRSKPSWSAAHEAAVLEHCASGCTLGDLLKAVDAEATAVVWHLIWTRRVSVDLTHRLAPTTPVTS